MNLDNEYNGKGNKKSIRIKIRTYSKLYKYKFSLL
nr:MAG TPA: hypothetical protein [Bacteriophage sp.]DAY82828.1 MAG TPA: hypothetical protein [Caudoviricetes sp.]